MSKFTPGKWEVMGIAAVAVINRKERNFHAICDCNFGEITEEHIEENNANARLIAESPVMYDLLNKAFHILGKNAANDAICREIDECLSRVDGAPVQKENGE